MFFQSFVCRLNEDIQQKSASVLLPDMFGSQDQVLKENESTDDETVGAAFAVFGGRGRNKTDYHLLTVNNGGLKDLLCNGLMSRRLDLCGRVSSKPTVDRPKRKNSAM